MADVTKKHTSFVSSMLVSDLSSMKNVMTSESFSAKIHSEWRDYAEAVEAAQAFALKLQKAKAIMH